MTMRDKEIESGKKEYYKQKLQVIKDEKEHNA
jgi:hypothetical protein